MIGKVLVGIGVWLISDGAYSWILYRQTQSWRGDKQTFIRDHWIRLLRMALGTIVLILGIQVPI